MKDKLGSRKLWIAIVGVLLQFINGYLAKPLPDDQLMQLSLIIVGYLISQGFVDSKNGIKNGNKN
jgi:hypothetical protein